MFDIICLQLHLNKETLNMHAEHFFIPPPLREDEEEILRLKGFEKDGDIVFDPLHPSKTIPITACDIVAGSLKIEPYTPRKWPTSIRLVAGFKRAKESVVVKQTICTTFTPKSFLASLPPPYMYIGGSNAKTSVQVLNLDCVQTGDEYVRIGNFRIKKITFDLKITLRVIERELVEETHHVTIK